MGTGNRTLDINGYNNNGDWNLYEGNRFGYTYKPCDSWVGAGVALETGHNIIRKNSSFYKDLSGLQMSITSNYYADVNYNKIYNNAFLDNGWNMDNGVDVLTSAVGLAAYDGSHVIKYNAFRNNLYYDHYEAIRYYRVSSGNQIFANNWEEAGDPEFKDISAADPMSSTTPDFTLQSNSPVIDAGKNLTTVSGVIDSDTVVVADAYFFQPGTWAAPLVGLKADEICIGTLSNCVGISSIAYSTNTIDTVSVHGAQVGDKIWLYKDSSGREVLVGSAPDIGAHEYGGHENLVPLPPKNLRIVFSD